MATPAKRLFRLPPSPARPSHSATYRLRRPTATPLYPVVQHHLETFLAQAAEVDPLGNGVPWWVEKDFRLSPLQLLERLVAFVPRPRMHRHRYHGVLAPHAGLRAAVVTIGRAPAETPRLVDAETPRPVPSDLDEPPRSASPARIRWAVLLARIYEVLPLLCPACGGSMKVLAFLTDPPVLSAIFVHLESGPPRNACCVG